MILELEPFRKVHVIFGRGFPVELQNNLTSSASLAKVSWEIYTTDGATENGEVSMRAQKSLKKTAVNKLCLIDRICFFYAI